MIQRRTGWKCCGQMRTKSSSSASTQLTMLGGGGMLPMTPRTPSPPSNMEVESLCFGCVFLLRGQNNCTASKGRWTGPCTVRARTLKPARTLKYGLWVGIPAWHCSFLMTWSRSTQLAFFTLPHSWLPDWRLQGKSFFQWQQRLYWTRMNLRIKYFFFYKLDIMKMLELPELYSTKWKHFTINRLVSLGHHKYKFV